MLTGGLLLVGFAAPSLADVGSADGATGTTSSVTSNAGPSTDTQAAEQATQPQDAAVRSAALSGPVALDGDNGNGLGNDQQCNPGQDEGCVPPGVCVPEDYNGSDPGCGTAPEVCIPEDYNGGDPGCGTPPEVCIPEDYNGSDPGCGNPPEVCIPEDYNGSDPGCGTPPEPGPFQCTPGSAGCTLSGECIGTDFAPDDPTSCGTPPDNGNGGGNGNGNGNGGNPPGQTTPPCNSGGNSGGNNGGQGPGTSAGGSSSSNGSGSEGTVPGASRPHRAPGTSACGDPAICNDSGILGVDASNSTPTTTSPSTVAGTGSSLPETGAAAGSQGMLVVGFGLLTAGALLVRPRRLARHRA
jgi:LPXTG-motif cell wall-anchored protein